jgi:hypothetical protein
LQSSRRLGDHLPSEEIVGAPDEMEVAKHRIGRLDRGVAIGALRTKPSRRSSTVSGPLTLTVDNYPT